MSGLRRMMSCRVAGGRFRAAASIMILSYLAFAGEAVHCQYFSSAHQSHAANSTAPEPVDEHAVHCLLANHAGSTVLDTDAASLLPTPTAAFRVVADDSSSLVSNLVQSTPARAPPLA